MYDPFYPDDFGQKVIRKSDHTSTVTQQLNSSYDGNDWLPTKTYNQPHGIKFLGANLVRVSGEHRHRSMMNRKDKLTVVEVAAPVPVARTFLSELIHNVLWTLMSICIQKVSENTQDKTKLAYRTQTVLLAKRIGMSSIFYVDFVRHGRIPNGGIDPTRRWLWTVNIKWPYRSSPRRA